ncbi:MAG: bifunctional 3,4-dihydroxy-2-butanone-4-phosphate synthase/GTP cyclohydrolase II [Hyphomicrobiales bacterium]|nr:MAG: bifunctional 3,4-dihydroxy-2-butanone-4-phosphate synthase/GTP cyclohydrolase II [Hyphomicrobiales bacterium]
MSRLTQAIQAIRRGEIVIVADADDRENEGDLIMAAEAATPEKIAFFLQHTSGVICAGLPGERCDELGLPPMVWDNQDPKGTAFTLSVDAADGVTTGISAADRALTLRRLADASAVPSTFVRPGHIFPLRSQAGGVLKRPGHTEASTDLMRMAGLSEVGVLSEVVTSDRQAMARTADLKRLASEYRIPFLTIEDIARYRSSHEQLVTHVSQAAMPTDYGKYNCHVFRSLIDGVEHVALTYGDLDNSTPVAVRVHSECLTGDIFGSRRCDCGQQLSDSLRLIAAEGAGVVVYMRGHEGRGIGLGDKLRAYALQEQGYDTVDANLALGLPVDSREYSIGAQILKELGVTEMRLITNNPDKLRAMQGMGIEIAGRIALPQGATTENRFYLETKQRRMGHMLTDVGAAHVKLG